MDVLDENEALQQFFAIESPEELDFGQLEQFITAEEQDFVLQGHQDGGPMGQGMAPPTLQPAGQMATNQPLTNSKPVISKNASMPSTKSQIIYDDRQYSSGLPLGHLPDSPPDSGSEPYSPQETKSAAHLGSPGVVNPLVTHSPVPHHPGDVSAVLQQQQPHGVVNLEPAAMQDQLAQLSDYLNGGASMLELASIPSMEAQQGVLQQQQQGTDIIGVLPGTGMPQDGLVGVAGGGASIEGALMQGQAVPVDQQQAGLQTGSLPQKELQRQESILTHQAKKRKHSLTPENSIRRNSETPVQIQIKQEPGTETCDVDLGVDNAMFLDQDYEYAAGDGMAYTDTPYQFIKWLPYQNGKWSTLLDATCQELPPPTYRVEADKGFNFSVVDDAFVCQKKNHFQVTCHVGMSGTAKYVKTDTGLKAVDSYQIHLHGIKVEALNSYIRVEQSQANRSKRPFQPVRIDIHPEKVTKVTIGRLHYSETTSNNMRKKGKPNPDQRFFMLVVAIHAHCEDQNFMLAAHVSERIIVRASNPGQFENDVDVMWQKGQTQDSIYHVGRMGINTDRPDEALVVYGNIRLTGHIVQPSDLRAKENIKEVDQREQLKNIGKVRIVQYNYIPEFAEQAGLPECDQVETGVIAQEVQGVLPDAVTETGDVYLPNGNSIDNFLTVNKDRIYMENVGAVKELCRLTDNLELRLDELEKINRKLAKLKRLDSFKSTSSGGTFSRSGSNRSGLGGSKGHRHGGNYDSRRRKAEEEDSCLTQRAMRVIIIILIFIMLFCIGSMVALYLIQLWETDSSSATDGSMSPSSPSGFNGTSNSETIDTDYELPSAAYPQDGRQADVPAESPECDDDCTLPSHTMHCCNFPSPPESFQVYSSESQMRSQMESYSSDPGADAASEETTSSESLQQVQRYLSRRRRGSVMANRLIEELSVSSLMVDKLDIMNHTVCTEPCGHDGNYTYQIVVPVFLPTISLQIEINTTTATRVFFCKWTSETLCPEVEEQPLPEEPNSIVGITHRWSKPVGLYFRTSFTFRVTSLQGDVNCHTGSAALGTGFLEYNLNFVRNISMCSFG